MLYLKVLATAFFVTLLVTPLVIKLGRKIGAIDHPDYRKSHIQSKPRLGGLGIFLGFFVSTILFSNLLDNIVIIVGALAMLVLGSLDDLMDLKPATKVLVEMIVAAMVVGSGLQFEFLSHSFSGGIILGWLSGPLTFLWIVGVTNAINLIDGLDGLASGIGIIAGFILALIAILNGGQAAFLSLALVGSLLGFIRYNFYPSKIFMGDSGSLFLGFILAILSIISNPESRTLLSLIVPVLILGVPIFDIIFAFARRLFSKKPIFQADKDHIHHRFLKLGFSQRKTVLILWLLSLFLGGSGLVMNFLTYGQRITLFISITIVLGFGASKTGLIGKKNH